VVSAGDLVGQVGNTGQSTGAHLHLGIYLDGTTATDPYAFLKELVGS
jgi:murein DD-endopeptidase MepM/ murein hydrolase activator NlpD